MAPAPADLRTVAADQGAAARATAIPAFDVGGHRRLAFAWLDWFVLIAASSAAAAYAALGLRVYRTLHASAFDLAFFDQVLWNTAHGRWFQTTYVSYSFLGQHFEPLLLPLALLYRLGAGPQTLIVLQALGAALAALPLYAAGRRLLPPAAAAALAIAYLVSPALQRGLDFGFHPDLLEPLTAFAVLAALLWRHDRLFLLCAGALLLVKEDAFLIGLALGWIALLRGRRRLGATVIAASLVYGVLVLTLIMPALRDGAASDLAERYGYLGSTPGSIVVGTLLHPDRVLAHLAAPAPLLAVLVLLGSFAFLPLLAPEVLIATLPAALVGLLSTHPQQRALDLQYGAPVLTLVTIAALFGLARMEALARRLTAPCEGGRSLPVRWQPSAAIALCLLVAAIGAAYLRGPFPPERAAAGWRFADGGAAAALARVARLIPPDASVSAQTGLAPHLSQRREQWEFPRLLGADYVVLQIGGIRSSQSLLAGFDAIVADLPELGYRLVAGDGPIRLYQREGAAH